MLNSVIRVGYFFKLGVPPVAFTASLESSSYLVYFKVCKISLWVISSELCCQGGEVLGDIIVIEQLLFNEFTGDGGCALMLVIGCYLNGARFFWKSRNFTHITWIGISLLPISELYSVIKIPSMVLTLVFWARVKGFTCLTFSSVISVQSMLVQLRQTSPRLLPVSCETVLHPRVLLGRYWGVEPSLWCDPSSADHRRHHHRAGSLPPLWAAGSTHRPPHRTLEPPAGWCASLHLTSQRKTLICEDKTFNTTSVEVLFCFFWSSHTHIVASHWGTRKEICRSTHSRCKSSRFVRSVHFPFLPRSHYFSFISNIISSYATSVSH